MVFDLFMLLIHSKFGLVMLGYKINLYVCFTQYFLIGVRIKILQFTMFWKKNGRVPFDRWLPPSMFEEWMEIINATFSFNFKQQPDEISWKWGVKKIYTTKSVYDHLTHQTKVRSEHIWKAKIPYKVKIFTWLLEKKCYFDQRQSNKEEMAGKSFQCLL